MNKHRDVAIGAAVWGAGGAVYGCFGWPEHAVPGWVQPLPFLLLGGMSLWGAVWGGIRGDAREEVIPGAIAGFIAGAIAGLLGLNVAVACAGPVPLPAAVGPLAWVVLAFLLRTLFAAGAGLVGGAVAVGFLGLAVALVGPPRTEP